MTSVESKGNAPSAQSETSRRTSGWGDVIPKSVVAEDCVGDREKNDIWNKMYGYANMGTANESERKALRAAVYVYGCINGTSREGDYNGLMTLSNGHEVSASVIPRATGKMKIRKFFRSNMAESYTFFKETKVMETHERVVAKAASYGISAENAFAMADWLDECPYFTPSESKAHMVVFTKSVDRARRARNGSSLEDVEEGRVDNAIRASGPNGDGNASGAIDW